MLFTMETALLCVCHSVTVISITMYAILYVCPFKLVPNLFHDTF